MYSLPQYVLLWTLHISEKTETSSDNLTNNPIFEVKILIKLEKTETRKTILTV